MNLTGRERLSPFDFISPLMPRMYVLTSLCQYSLNKREVPQSQTKFHDGCPKHSQCAKQLIGRSEQESPVLAPKNQTEVQQLRANALISPFSPVVYLDVFENNETCDLERNRDVAWDFRRRAPNTLTSKRSVSIYFACMFPRHFTQCTPLLVYPSNVLLY